MPLQLDWFVPDQVIMLKIDGANQPTELVPFAAQIQMMVSAVDTPLVHIFIDITELTDFSKNARDYMKLDLSVAENTGWIIIIGGNAMMRFMASIIVSRVTGHGPLRVEFLADMKGAIRYVAARDPFLTEATVLAYLDNEQQLPLNQVNK